MKKNFITRLPDAPVFWCLAALGTVGVFLGSPYGLAWAWTLYWFIGTLATAVWLYALGHFAHASQRNDGRSGQ